MLSLLLDIKFQEHENPKVHLYPFGDSKLGGSGLCLFLLNLGFKRGQRSQVSLKRDWQEGPQFPRAVLSFHPKCQKGLSDLLALVSPLAALQMTLFVCLQRQPGRLRRS